MAEAAVMNAGTLRQTIESKPWLRQIMMMVGIAASVAVGVAAVMWSQEPEYRTLYGSMPPERSASVLDALSSSGIPYRLQQQTGAILVPADRLHDARIQLAGSGVINDGSGLEMLREEKGFGVSDFMQSKKYEHALETELARTIESMHQVRKARVHLAIPKQTVFVRDQRSASASVMLDIYAGSTLDRQQVRAIINMVSGSVPELDATSVTVVDQTGNLLSSLEEETGLEVSAKQFEYRKKIEKEYENRITNLLTPIAGLGKVKVQAAVELDFSRMEESRESWNPEAQVLRSEQVNTNRRGGAAGAGGVPGALANQPVGRADANGGENETTESSSITRNYEIERVLNYTARPAGDIQRISVAVVLDDAVAEPTPDGEGEGATKAAYTADQLAQLSGLVRDAIGFDEARGDRVSVIATSFRPAMIEEGEPEAPPLWEQPWFVGLLKQVLTGIAVILIVFSVIRPSIKSLMQAQTGAKDLAPAANSGHGGGAELSPAIAALAAPGSVQKVEEGLDAIREVADQDPKLVAQVVKNWVARDGK
ncbi:flagellar M-ring protein FliF [Litorivivens lipolytica]|uniref:Flagellar M-ring protein n=1 Tax=Litorivivens lipolytica TaxID=1524264 RepID=A0A7W4Z4S0_9GAMM|nr:flagellar basal-body MS-ring/collar protein FliF [Litorivivens lipolytica]MBB3046367.1 flagellar M-ring protein FliF [Litorivivens lipolytica]